MPRAWHPSLPIAPPADNLADCTQCAACVRNAASLLPAVAPAGTTALAEAVYTACLDLYASSKAAVFPRQSSFGGGSSPSPAPYYGSPSPGNNSWWNGSWGNGSWGNDTSGGKAGESPRLLLAVSESVAPVSSTPSLSADGGAARHSQALPATGRRLAADYRPSAALDVNAGSCKPVSRVACALQGTLGQCWGACSSR